MLIEPPNITKITSKAPGPTLAVITGIHGNELTGPLAIESILPTLHITKGNLYMVLANPSALKVQKRQVNKNLNRCFYPNNTGSDYEDQSAR